MTHDTRVISAALPTRADAARAEGLARAYVAAMRAAANTMLSDQHREYEHTIAARIAGQMREIAP